MNKFVMLVGPAASGKSTCAKKLVENNENYVVVSSDSIREELYGDESIQGDPSEVFEICKQRCVQYLNNEKDVIFDATNLNRKKRKGFLLSVLSGVKVFVRSYCIVVATTYEDCIAQNEKRDRHVPEYVIRKHFNQFQMPLYTEGWDNIDFVNVSTITLEDMLEKCKGLEHDNHHHKYNVYDHIQRTEQWIANNMNTNSPYMNLLLNLALWHDIGKVYTKSFSDKNGNPTEEAHFYNHEAWSSIYCLCDNIYSHTFRVDLAQLVSLHMMKFNSEYDAFINKWCPEFKDILNIFNEADKQNS